MDPITTFSFVYSIVQNNYFFLNVSVHNCHLTLVTCKELSNFELISSDSVSGIKISNAQHKFGKV